MLHTFIFKRIRKLIWVLFLWFLFSIGCFCAPFIAIAIAIPATRKSRYMQFFIRAADRLCAAMLGFTGRFMLSTELANEPRLRWMYYLLNEIETNHCEESVYEEGAYCRLYDRRLGAK
jgi:hypothetical protein